MANADEPQTEAKEPLRVLFCIGGTQNVYDADDAELAALTGALSTGFADLSGRFGIKVLGTLDDDLLMLSATTQFPWGCYILADCPDLEAVKRVCAVVRDTRVGNHRLWKYVSVDVRIGRPLFFGNE